jgi:putative serine protease PepD
LKIDKVLELKSKYKVAKNFAIETDKNLGKRKKIKYRGSAGNIYKKYARSVVFIYNATKGHEGTGAGFLVDSSGVFLSNWHVTDKAESLYVWLLPKSGAVGIKTLFKDVEPYFGVVFAVDVEKDLALIKVNGLPKDLKVIEMGSNSDVAVGDNVVAIGHPNTFPWTLTVGTVSQIRRNHEWVALCSDLSS